MPSETQADQIREVFAHYRTYKPRSHRQPHDKLKEWRLVKARLKEGYEVAELKKAIDGCFLSPFHQGKNNGGKKYDSLELIMRDGGKVDGFYEIAVGGLGHQRGTEPFEAPIGAWKDIHFVPCSLPPKGPQPYWEPPAPGSECGYFRLPHGGYKKDFQYFAWSADGRKAVPVAHQRKSPHGVRWVIPMDREPEEHPGWNLTPTQLHANLSKRFPLLGQMMGWIPGWRSRRGNTTSLRSTVLSDTSEGT